MRAGFIHDKLDIKILILFIMGKIPEPISYDQLTELVLCDDGVDYFLYAESVPELVATGHLVMDEDGLYTITEKGRQGGYTCESSIAYSVRTKADKAVYAFVQKLRRNAMIHTACRERKEGGYDVRLSLSDGFGSILNVEILAGSEEQAGNLRRNFRENAEKIFNAVLEDLLREY